MAKIIFIINKVILQSSASRNLSLSHVQFFSKLPHDNSNKESDYFQYERTDKLFTISREGTLKVLQDLLRVNKISATDMIANCRELHQVPPKLIMDNYEVCQRYAISRETVVTCPFLLAEKNLLEKVHLLSEAPNDINQVVGLLKMNVNDLWKTIIQLKKGGDRVSYFSKLLNVSSLEVCEQIRKKPFLMKLSLEKTSEIIDLLKDHGITDREIINDLWALHYKKSTMEKRIQFARDNNLEKVKTWMIRAPPHILLNYIKIRTDNKLILGNNSLAEYLSHRLECPIEQANYIISKLPALKGKSVKKMDEIIDFLYEERFKPVQICITPKILLHSVDTMKKRIHELQEQGVYSDNLRLLTKTQKQYQIYLNKLISENKKKLRSIK